MRMRLDASVVIALNAHDNDLSRVFESYSRQTAPAGSFELVIVNGGRVRTVVEDVLQQFRRAFPSQPARLVQIELSGRAAANNAGARASRSNLLILMADDFLASPTLVRAHTEFHRCAGNAAAVGVGPAFFTDSLRNDSFRRWLEDSGRLFAVPFRLAETGWPREFFYAGNASLSRRLYEKVGGFDEDFRYDLGDDLDFGLRLRRAGARSHFLPKAAAWHDHAVTLDERVEALRRIGAAARTVAERHGAAMGWETIIAQPLAALMAAALDAEERDCAASTPGTRVGRYQAVLDLAFAQGYLDSLGHACGADSPLPARRDVNECG